MSEEALWYAARIAGLMTLILAVGSLCAGFLMRNRTEEPTPASQWTVDTHRFLGVASLIALLIHGSAVVAGERSSLAVSDALTGYRDGSWMSEALVAGIVCGWMLVLVEVGRAVSGHRRSRSGAGFAPVDVVTTLFAIVVVGGGAFHAWVIGSDTRNVITVIVAGFAAVVLAGTASLGAATLFRGSTSAVDYQTSEWQTSEQQSSPGVTPRSIVSQPKPEVAQERSLGSWNVSVEPLSNGDHTAPPDRFDPQLTVSLSRRVGEPTAPAPISPGPQITSARNITAEKGATEQSATGTTANNSENGSQDNANANADANAQPVPPPPRHRL